MENLFYNMKEQKENWKKMKNEINCHCPYCGHDIKISTQENDHFWSDSYPSGTYNVVALIGASGSGKDTIKKLLLENDYRVADIQATTTRPQRDGEASDAYYFVSQDKFLAMDSKGMFFVKAQFRDWFYGTTYSSLNPSAWNVGIFSPKNIHQMVNNPVIKLKTFYIKTCEKERMMRSLEREGQPDIDEIIRRCYADREDFKEEKLTFPHTTLMNNNKDDLLSNVDFIRNQLGRTD